MFHARLSYIYYESIRETCIITSVVLQIYICYIRVRIVHVLHTAECTFYTLLLSIITKESHVPYVENPTGCTLLKNIVFQGAKCAPRSPATELLVCTSVLGAAVR
jgi:hypothetical protein